MNKNLLLASGAAALMLVTTGCATKAVAPAPAPAPVKSYVIEGVLFAFDSASLTSAGEAKVAEAAAGIKAASGHTFNVVGHTDPIGSDANNLRLGAKRAQTVVNALMRNGVSASQLKAASMGERQLVRTDCGDRATKAAIECNAPNRRVEITPVAK
jgi:OOP family OmpA-OmpF porin